MEFSASFFQSGHYGIGNIVLRKVVLISFEEASINVEGPKTGENFLKELRGKADAMCID